MSATPHITPESRLSTFYKAHGLKQALNRAIRAECAGGPELIESMTAMHKTAVLLHKRGAVAEYKVACAALEMLRMCGARVIIFNVFGFLARRCR